MPKMQEKNRSTCNIQQSKVDFSNSIYNNNMVKSIHSIKKVKLPTVHEIIRREQQKNMTYKRAKTEAFEKPG